MKLHKLLIASLVLSFTLTGCGDSGEQLFPNKFSDDSEIITTEDYSVFEDIKTVAIYTNKGLHKYLNTEVLPTFDDLRRAMDSNPTIEGEFKIFLSDFIDKLEVKYPSMDLTVFYYNIQNVTVQYVQSEYMPGAMDSTSTPKGYFTPEGCQMYINSDCSHDELIQVIPHEIGHMLVNMIFEKKGYTIQRDYTKSGNYGFMLEEALNSKFVNDLMEIDSNDLPYQMPVNYVELLMEATDYTMEDYLSGSIIDYLNCLEANGISEDDAARTIAQMENQKYNVRRQHDVDVPDSDFACLYEVYSYVYFNNMITGEMNHDEIVALYMHFYNTLTTKIDYDKLDMSPCVTTLYRVLEEKNMSSVAPKEEELPTTMGLGQ